MSNELVSDADVEKALDWLRDNAADIGRAKEHAIMAERMTKHVKALEMQRHNELPVSAQDREATASAAYLEALMREAEAAGEYERLRALREAAALKIEVWRSASANYRAMKIG
jgi:predicted RNA-binding Zn ribbon-like protein